MTWKQIFCRSTLGQSIISVSWGIFTYALGFSVSHNWQAWVIIFMANLTFLLGKYSK